MTPPRLLTERLLVRMIEPGDAPKVLAYFRAAGTRHDPPLPDAFLTLEHWVAHSQQVLKDHADGSGVRLFAFTPDETEIVATLGLTRITRGVRFDCTLSYTIRASHEGKGLMAEAVGAAIGFAFGELGLHRIEASHAPDNQRSRRLLERLGFEHVGTIRDFLYSGGQWRDTVLHSLLNPAWQAH